MERKNTVFGEAKNGNKTVHWSAQYCLLFIAGTAAGSIIFCLRKKNSYRQNLRNATNLLSTFESSPTCLFNMEISDKKDQESSGIPRSFHRF